MAVNSSAVGAPDTSSPSTPMEVPALEEEEEEEEDDAAGGR